MVSDVALIVIYNHKYEKNIDRLEGIYGERFSNIFHIIPFYKGNRENVISVYENSYYFQGYVAQSYKIFFDEKFEHYFFIADDLILNPLINEKNYAEILKLNGDSNYLTGFNQFHEISNYYWERVKEAFLFNIDLDGLEIGKELPDYETALKCFENHGLTLKMLTYNQVFDRPRLPKIKTVGSLLTLLFTTIKWCVMSGYGYQLSYPLVGAYSDIFVLHKSAIKQFCHYSGIFASAELFVEIAIPTSMALLPNRIITSNDIGFKDGALWTNEQYEILNPYQFNLNKLLNEFPENYLYIHPIKLSKW